MITQFQTLLTVSFLAISSFWGAQSFSINSKVQVAENFQSQSLDGCCWHNSALLRFQKKKRLRSFLIYASDESNDGDAIKNGVEEELEMLQQKLNLIEALEERNKAQLDSFVDEEDQWDSLEDYEKELLESKAEVLERMETITEELLQLWMGAKSMEG